MSTPHIACEPGDIAPLVIMPGDPMRAERIASTRLEDVKLVSNVRGIGAWTGHIDGTPVTAMASGMGVPSLSIYATELYRDFGVERREGSLEERAAAYIDEIRSYSAGRPVILGGWSFGGALAYEVAHQLVGSDIEIEQIVLLDTVQPSEPVPDTMEETKARWKRYQAFAKKTYGLDFPVPFELLESAGEEALLAMMGEFLANTDATEHGLSAGVLEHQRASFVDNRILDKVDLGRWADVQVPVLLFRAERMHDGAIELEPRLARIDPDGGWSAIVNELEIVQLSGDHLAIVDEPVIGTVGAHLTRRIEELARNGN